MLLWAPQEAGGCFEGRSSYAQGPRWASQEGKDVAAFQQVHQRSHGGPSSHLQSIAINMMADTVHSRRKAIRRSRSAANRLLRTGCSARRGRWRPWLPTRKLKSWRWTVRVRRIHRARLALVAGRSTSQLWRATSRSRRCNVRFEISTVPFSLFTSLLTNVSIY